MNAITSSNPPSKPDYYWAKEGSYQWYNLIVELRGTAPLLHCPIIFDTSNDKTREHANIHVVFGPEIIRPEP